MKSHLYFALACLPNAIADERNDWLTMRSSIVPPRFGTKAVGTASIAARVEDWHKLDLREQLRRASIPTSLTNAVEC